MDSDAKQKTINNIKTILNYSCDSCDKLVAFLFQIVYYFYFLVPLHLRHLYPLIWSSRVEKYCFFLFCLFSID